MRRPGQEGGVWGRLNILPPAVKLADLRAFLIVEALRENEAALHLLRELPRAAGKVKA